MAIVPMAIVPVAIVPVAIVPVAIVPVAIVPVAIVIAVRPLGGIGLACVHRSGSMPRSDPVRPLHLPDSSVRFSRPNGTTT
jgi:hypothetical protein